MLSKIFDEVFILSYMRHQLGLKVLFLITFQEEFSMAPNLRFLYWLKHPCNNKNMGLFAL